MSRPKVIITGVKLLNPEGNRWLAADLWTLDDIFVINANGGEWWGPAGQDYVHTFADKTIQPRNHECYFERRGVFVMKCGDASLSQAAVEYIARGL